MIYMFLSNNPSSGDINSSNLSCLIYHTSPIIESLLKSVIIYQTIIHSFESARKVRAS